jgi:hypothetical protein
MWHQKLKAPMKIRFASKVIMFEKTLEFKQAIMLCYNKQKTSTLQPIIFKAQVWAIMEIVIHFLNHVVMTCVMNRSRNHWLLSNLIVIMEFEVDPLVDGNETFDLFDVSTC